MGTPPDINVRPARRPAAESAHDARRSGLARLLLGTSLKFVFLLAVSSSTPACVVPVSPEFQDPPGTLNAAPEISNPKPFPGPVAGTTEQTFSFNVSDPNGGSPLYMRWLSDFVPFSGIASRKIIPMMVTVSPSADGSIKNVLIEQKVQCSDVYGEQTSTHQIIAAVSDRPYLDDGSTNWLDIPDPGKQNTIVWTLTLTSCPMSQSP
jgi:hypothetical protein